MSGAVEKAAEALARGDLIAAYDLTASAAGEEESSALRHLQILALARMGDTERAREMFDSHGLAKSPDPHHRAVGARLLKDRALALPPGQERLAALSDAFEAYHSIYLKSNDSFPGINAATLAFLGDRSERAEALARAVLTDPAVAEGVDYYRAATRAEALLILGRIDDASRALRAPIIGDSHDHGARSTTRRQLAMIATGLDLSESEQDALLEPLMAPKVAHYCGHMFAADADAEARIRADIDAILAEEKVGFAYGSLASGADLLFAEAVLDRGIELHAVLPFEEEDFLAQSVVPGGKSWITRYRSCVQRAAGLTHASEMEYFGDPAQYGYASRIAMGLARLRAAHLGADAVQIAVWDGKASSGPAGTGADVAAWRDSGGRSVVIDPGPLDRALDRPEARVKSEYQRVHAAILFTDFVGFSTLKETRLPAFWDGVMRHVAAVLDEHEAEVECRNSWGDALYAVTSSAPTAAEIALELQDRLAEFDYATLGLDGSGGMRIGAHYGPAYRTVDHITGRTTFYGTEVSKAARIEPIAPPGAVFVTEPLAAILALEAGERFACRYVGRIPLAKKYGEHPMYRLSRVRGDMG
ncbi:MAG TPA: adenylate/guanylate cyclase domain-containing protein [Allosphingosinicella sp.]|nr:adenylate/guanylate cyclase domain-containing protein [Allosphingosinicella sp.]